MNKRILTCALAVGVVLTALAARHRAILPPPAPKPIDIRRSLVITERNLLDGFDFQRVMETLTSRSGTGTTPLQLYQQWFDTQNPKPGLVAAGAPHCDDFITDGKPSFNGFPRRCPTPEGVLATSDPFTAHDYVPMGITNRFDLTPVDGANCGQYRLIFGKTGTTGQKLHIIFEPILPNPNPALGAAGCRAVAQFWADLSGVDSATERRARLERFFFDGIDGFEPVLHPSHFTEQTGRIRTFQSLAQPARFYQFHLRVENGKLLMVPGVLENLAYAQLYNAASPQPLGKEFRDFFVTQVATLAIRDVNGFFDQIPNKYLMHESDPDNNVPQFSAGGGLGAGKNTAEGKAFMDALAQEITRAGSTMRIDELMIRADLNHCVGCHLGGAPIGDGLSFPFATGGAHVDDRVELSGDATRFVISPALRDVFAPNRARILTDFLSGKSMPVHSTGTLGGGRTSD